MKQFILLLFIISFFASGTSIYSQEPAPTPFKPSKIEENKPTIKYQNAEGKQRNANNSSVVVKKIETVSPNQSEKDQTKSYYDETTFKWTDCLLVFFTGILAVFTALLWRSTDKMWKSTKDAAEAAKSNANTLLVIEKAYVIVAVKKGKPEIFGDEIVDVVIRNDGRTPATIIKHNAILFGKEGSLDIEAHDIPTGTELGSNRKIIIPILLKKTKTQMASKEAIALCCYVSIEYEDIFKQRYIKKSVWEYESSFNCPAGRWNICDNKNLDNYTQNNPIEYRALHVQSPK